MKVQKNQSQQAIFRSIRTYLSVGLIIAVVAVSACLSDEKVQEIPKNVSEENTTHSDNTSNTTNQTSTGPISIPLEKPPFID